MCFPSRIRRQNQISATSFKSYREKSSSRNYILQQKPCYWEIWSSLSPFFGPKHQQKQYRIIFKLVPENDHPEGLGWYGSAGRGREGGLSVVDARLEWWGGGMFRWTFPTICITTTASDCLLHHSSVITRCNGCTQIFLEKLITLESYNRQDMNHTST